MKVFIIFILIFIFISDELLIYLHTNFTFKIYLSKFNFLHLLFKLIQIITFIHFLNYELIHYNLIIIFS